MCTKKEKEALGRLKQFHENYNNFDHNFPKWKVISLYDILK